MNTARSNSIANKLRPLFRLRYAFVATALLGAASALAQQKPESQDSLIRRYPFDPACPWGRIGNGKGMIVRCISAEEAERLLQDGGAEPPSEGGPAGGGAPQTAPSEGGDDAPAPVSAEGLAVTVGPIVADQGELSIAKLAQPKSRYARCVTDHGGLKDRSGEVHVRFLVRSKGIAEGVSVHKRVNVSAATARCVADIVDRRRVGTPDAPLVGATVVVKFEKSDSR
jgi:hypothetical protein